METNRNTGERNTRYTASRNDLGMHMPWVIWVTAQPSIPILEKKSPRNAEIIIDRATTSGETSPPAEERSFVIKGLPICSIYTKDKDIPTGEKKSRFTSKPGV